jgi:hypothetical protein
MRPRIALNACCAVIVAVTLTAGTKRIAQSVDLYRDEQALRSGGSWNAPSSELLSSEWYKTIDVAPASLANGSWSDVPITLLIVVAAGCLPCERALERLGTALAEPVERPVEVLVASPEVEKLPPQILARLRSQAPQVHVLSILEPQQYSARSGISIVPMAVVIRSGREIVAVMQGVPSDATIARLRRELSSPHGQAPWVSRDSGTRAFLRLQ